MATLTFTPASFDSDYSAYSVSGQTQVIGKNTTSTTYATVQLSRGSSATTYASWKFDCSEIPANATIDSVSCSVKVYINGTSSQYVKTKRVQLYSGSTAKGSASTVSNSTTAITMTAGSWTRAELDDAKIRLYAVRGTRNTSTNYYFRFYGALLTVNYTENNTKYTLTINNEAGVNIDPPVDTDYFEGSTATIAIVEDSMPQVLLDGTDITDQFVAQSSVLSYSGAPNAYSITGSLSNSNNAQNAVGRTAENPSTTNTNWYGSSGAAVDSQYVQYTFDLSSVPSNATNIQVACKVAGTAENSTYSHQSGGRYSVWGLCSNGTAKGAQIYTNSTSVTTVEFTDTGSWTREELNNLQLRHYVGYYGGSTRGATLTVNYSDPNASGSWVYSFVMDAEHRIEIKAASSDEFYVKQNGSWVKVVKVYKKVNGSWIEQTDLGSVFNIPSSSNTGYYKI